MESTEDTATSKTEEAPKETTPPKPLQEKAPLTAKDVPPKRSKKEERQHKKEDRAVEQFLKSLDSLPSSADKLSLVSKKFTEVAEENRRLQSFIKQSEKRFSTSLKEKEQLQLEYNRTVLVKSKLENLCRELQKQNKSIKEESLLKIREEEERRKETQAKFQSALSEITTLLQQNNEKNSKLRDDNINMSGKFKSVVEKYELREQQVEKMAKQMSLEQQLSEAKLAKAGLEAQADRERLMTDIAQLKLELGQCHARIVESQGTESSLRSQLAVYTDKYDEFQNALVKSNQVFGGFKGEMEKMSKKITKLEKECMSWKKRWETSQTALLEMVTDKRLWDERAATSERQLAQLQRLCRTMQAERTVLLNTLKENNIERPPMPVLPPAPPLPAPQPTAPSKVDAMAANCAQLKQSLAQLQNQLNVLTTKKEEENQAKTEELTSKPKKGKGKKSKVDREKTPQENATTKAESGKAIPDEDRADSEGKETSPEKINNETPKDNVTADVEVNAPISHNETKPADSSTDIGSVAPVDVPLESTADEKPIASTTEIIESTVDVKPVETGIENVETMRLTIDVEQIRSTTEQAESTVECEPAIENSKPTVAPAESTIDILPVATESIDKTDGANQEAKVVSSNDATVNNDKLEQNYAIVTNGTDSNVSDEPKDLQVKCDSTVVNGETNGASDDIDTVKLIENSALSPKDTLNPAQTDETPAIGVVKAEKVAEKPQSGSIVS